MFIIRPKPKIFTANEFSCCVNGKTETEGEFASGVLADYVDEQVTGPDDDGKYTTTWTTKTIDDEGLSLEFYLCCATESTVAWDSGALFTRITYTGNDIELDFVATGASGEETTNILALNGPCGIRVIILWDTKSSGTGTFSLTY